MQCHCWVPPQFQVSTYKPKRIQKFTHQLHLNNRCFPWLCRCVQVSGRSGDRAASRERTRSFRKSRLSAGTMNTKGSGKSHATNKTARTNKTMNTVMSKLSATRQSFKSFDFWDFFQKLVFWCVLFNWMVCIGGYSSSLKHLLRQGIHQWRELWASLCPEECIASAGSE